MEEMTHRARVYEFATVCACEAVLALDTRLYGARVGAPDQTLNYYVGINTWIGMVYDHRGDLAAQRLLDAIYSHGLRAVVLRFSDSANALVRGEIILDRLVSAVIYDRSSPAISGGDPTSNLSVQLTLCRYLKRFLADFDRPRQDALEQFVRAQQELEQFAADRRVDLQYLTLVGEVRRFLYHLPIWDRVIDALDTRDPVKRSFTPGAASETGRSFGKKLTVMWNQNPMYFQRFFGSMGASLPCPDDPGVEWINYGLWEDAEGFDPGLDRVPLHVVSLSTAPKSAKGPRIIATEPLQYQTASKWSQQMLYRIRIPGMDLNDQSVNQRLALLGSLHTESFATVDLSSASDYVTKALLADILPAEVVERLKLLAPTHFRLPDDTRSGAGCGDVYPLYSFATMGNGLTFWFESLVFWAIARVACRDCGGDDWIVSVYGDDIVLPVRAYDRLCTYLETLGFKVNADKSYAHGPYRESCGVEGWNGHLLDVIYYPRFPVVGEVTDHHCALSEETDLANGFLNDCTARLVSLQHRLWAFSPRASRFTEAVVADAHPNMTYSGDEDPRAPDLWSFDKRRPSVSQLYTSGVVAKTRLVNGVTEYCSRADGRLVWSNEVANQGDLVRVAPVTDTGLQRDQIYMRKLKLVPREENGKAVVALCQAYRYGEFLANGPSLLYEDKEPLTGGYVPGYCMTVESQSVHQLIDDRFASYSLRAIAP